MALPVLATIAIEAVAIPLIHKGLEHMFSSPNKRPPLSPAVREELARYEQIEQKNKYLFNDDFQQRRYEVFQSAFFAGGKQLYYSERVLMFAFLFCVFYGVSDILKERLK